MTLTAKTALIVLTVPSLLELRLRAHYVPQGRTPIPTTQSASLASSVRHLSEERAVVTVVRLLESTRQKQKPPYVLLLAPEPSQMLIKRVSQTAFLVLIPLEENLLAQFVIRANSVRRKRLVVVLAETVVLENSLRGYAHYRLTVNVTIAQLVNRQLVVPLLAPCVLMALLLLRKG